MLLTICFVVHSAEISVDTQTHTHILTDRHRPSTVNLAAHARRGLMIDQRAVIASGDHCCTTEREKKPEPNSKIRTLTNKVGNPLVHKQHSIHTYSILRNKNLSMWSIYLLCMLHHIIGIYMHECLCNENMHALLTCNC